MKLIRKFAGGGAVFAVLMLSAAAGAKAQAVTALPSVDLDRFAGSWYEIARLPNKREKKCIADVVELIALADKKDHLQLVHSCKAKNDYTDVANANLKAEKGSGGGKLKVTYIWPFSEKEWVLDVGPNYEWALLGSPNKKMLKVVSRTASLAPEVLTAMKLKAASQGYAVERLKMTLQTRQ